MTQKYSPQKLLYEEKFKSTLHKIVNEKLMFLAQVATKKI